MYLHQEIGKQNKSITIYKGSYLSLETMTGRFLSALIGIEFETVSNWALRKNIRTHNLQRFIRKRKTCKNLIWSEVKKANAENLHTSNQKISG